MKDIIMDTLIDGIKLVPFLFIAFLFIELLEHKFNNKGKKIISKTGKFGPIIGGILGIIPQCGFSVMATNLYVTRIITLGTLIAIYLSTSDEMLPILIAHNVKFDLIFKILITKVIFAIIYGIFIDLIINKFRKKENVNYEICDHDHCHCEDKNIFKSTLIHTFNIFIFILVISLILNVAFNYLGEELISKYILKDSIFELLIACLIGLIPNCGASVMLTELYLSNVISYSALMSGLLTGSGVALLVLFKTNKDKKQSIFILTLLYLIGVLSGIILKFI